jgi:hypothetical protein
VLLKWFDGVARCGTMLHPCRCPLPIGSDDRPSCVDGSDQPAACRADTTSGDPPAGRRQRLQQRDPPTGRRLATERHRLSAPVCMSWPGWAARAPRPCRRQTVRRVRRTGILQVTLSPPAVRLAVTHWSTWLLACELGVRHHHRPGAARLRVQPWRAETFKLSTDPQLEIESKVHDGVGLTCTQPRPRRSPPPQRAAHPPSH